MCVFVYLSCCRVSIGIIFYLFIIHVLFIIYDCTPAVLEKHVLLLMACVTPRVCVCVYVCVYLYVIQSEDFVHEIG